MKNRDGLENNDNWGTPVWLYNELNWHLKFDFDPCPLNHNIEKWDGLKVSWGRSNFINPPYNRVDKPKWIRKTHAEWLEGRVCTLLIPSSTGTKDYHKYILPDSVTISMDEFRKHVDFYMNSSPFKKIIIHLEGRLAFKGYNTKGEYTEKNKGKHDSMIIIFKQP